MVKITITSSINMSYFKKYSLSLLACLKSKNQMCLQGCIKNALSHWKLLTLTMHPSCCNLKLFKG